MAAVADRTAEAAAEGTDLRSFLAKRGVTVDPAAGDDQALKELDEKYIIARDLDAAAVLSKIRDVLGLVHREESIVAYEGLSYQLPSRDLEQHEYDPLLRQLCLRRGKFDSCAVGDPKTSRRAKIITALLSLVQKALLGGHPTSSHFLCYGDGLFKRDQKTVDDALLDICCLLECTRTSLSVIELTPGTVIGPLMLTSEHGEETHCRRMGGTHIPEGISKITVTSGADPKFILVVQRGAVFEDFASNKFHLEFSCVIITGGDGQPNIPTRAFLRKLKDSLSVPVYGLFDPDPEGLSIFCTYKFGSSEMPFDNVGLTVPDMRWIGVSLGDDLDINDEMPLTKKDISILEELCAKKYAMGDELLRTNIHLMMYKGVKSKIEALYHHQFPATDYILKAISNQEDI
jgi:meiotic recombination protein SPO11